MGSIPTPTSRSACCNEKCGAAAPLTNGITKAGVFRPITSSIRQDGTGVEAETGDDLYATTFYFYDGFGNLTNVIEPRGNYVSKTYDSVGQLRTEIFYSPSGTALATNGYGYEPGGLVSSITN